MSLSALSIFESGDKPKPGFDANNPRDVAAARHAAMEFESMLLSQLTAALNPATSDDEEESLFGGNTSNYYKQMFSEQMARQLAEKGGVGLADAIMQKLGVGTHQPVSLRTLNASHAARAIRAASPAAEAATEILPSATVAPATRPRIARTSAISTPTAALTPDASASSPLATPAPMSAAEIREASRLRIPVRGRVSSQFGARRDPLHGKVRRHQGVDIAAQRGTPIAAAAGGTVVFAGKRGGYGNLVEIEHADGRRTRYAHAEKILVKVGDQVERGETVATVGSTGRSTGPHLHFEVKEEHGARIDPLQAVAKDSAPTRR